MIVRQALKVGTHNSSDKYYHVLGALHLHGWDNAHSPVLWFTQLLALIYCFYFLQQKHLKSKIIFLSSKYLSYFAKHHYHFATHHCCSIHAVSIFISISPFPIFSFPILTFLPLKRSLEIRIGLENSGFHCIIF